MGTNARTHARMHARMHGPIFPQYSGISSHSKGACMHARTHARTNNSSIFRDKLSLQGSSSCSNYSFLQRNVTNSTASFQGISTNILWNVWGVTSVSCLRLLELVKHYWARLLQCYITGISFGHMMLRGKFPQHPFLFCSHQLNPMKLQKHLSRIL